MTQSQKTQIIKNLFMAALGIFSYMMEVRDETKRKKRLEKVEKDIERLQRKVFGNVIEDS